MTRRRVITLLVVFTGLLTFTVFPLAHGYEGSSIYDNVAPKAETHGLSEKYPSDRYGLDINVLITETPHTHIPGSGGLLDSIINVPRTEFHLDDAPALIEHKAASVIWSLDRLLTSLVLTLFSFAFSLDLIGGQHGVLAPITHAVNNLYDELGREWMAFALALVGAYAAYQMLWMRRIASTFGTLFVSMLMVFAAMLLITQTDWTLGGAARLNTQLSNAILGAINGDNSQDAKTAAVDAFYEQFTVLPFVVLNFGGLEHCVDQQGNVVKPKDPKCGDRAINNRVKYAALWLKYPPNGPERKLLFKAVADGKMPSGDELDKAGMKESDLAGLHLSERDKPAVDIQQAPAADDRLAWAAGIFAGSLGGKLLVGGLAIGVILKAVLALLLFAFAPIMALLAFFPGAGQRAFRTWFVRMFLLIFAACWAALLLASVFAVARALTKSSSELGFGLSWALIAFFFWMVLFYRKELEAFLLRAIAGDHSDRGGERSIGQRARDLHYTGRMVTPVAAAGVGAVAYGLGKGKKNTRRVAGASREGAREGVRRLNAYAAKGNTAADRVRNAKREDKAYKQLAGEHASNVNKLRDEETRRKRVKELRNRQEMSHDAIKAGKDAKDISLTPAERQELARLEKSGMDKDTHQKLRDRVMEVEDRTAAAGSKEPVFSEAELVARRGRIAAQEEAKAKQADYSKRNRGAKHDGGSSSSSGRDRSSRPVRERAKRWSTRTAAHARGTDSAPQPKGGARRTPRVRGGKTNGGGKTGGGGGKTK